MSLVATSEREWRSARRAVLPVTLRGILAGGIAGDIGAGGNQRLIEQGDEPGGHFGARMAERQACGIAGDLEGDLGGGGDDDGERAGPETARQDEEAGGQ